MRSFEYALKMKDGEWLEENGNVVNQFEKAQLPEYQTSRAAGADFFAAEDTVVPSILGSVARTLATDVKGFVYNWVKDSGTDKPKEELVSQKLFKPTLVHTGIKANMEEDEVLELYNRSSGPKRGLILANGVGVVDADYYENKDNDGEIGFIFYNILPWDVTIKQGDRIGQGVFKKVLRPKKGLRVKEDERVGGFGSTN